MELSGQLQGSATGPLGIPRNTLNRKRGGSQNQPGRFGREKDLLLLTRIEPQSLGIPAPNVLSMPITLTQTRKQEITTDQPKYSAQK